MDTTQAAGLEALLFLADEPVPTPVLAEATGLAEHAVDEACQRLADQLRGEGRGITVRRAGGGWRMYTAEVAWPVVEKHVLAGRSGRLSTAALETLAVIAYKQPITRSAIGEVRGVNPDGAVRSLVARGYVEEVGREATPGQPVLYGTTTRLLEELGLDDLSELPDLADHLPEEDAPDEPADLRAARRLLADGGTLPSTGAGRWAPDDADEGDDGDEADDPAASLRDDQEASLRDAPSASLRDDPPASLRDDGGLGPPSSSGADARGDNDLDDLTSRVEDAARSAMGQLRAAMEATERLEAGDHPDPDAADPDAPDPVDDEPGEDGADD